MSEITYEQKREAQDIWGDIWNYWKKYYNPEDNDEYWHNLVEEANELARRHNHNNFLEGMILLCVDDIEKREGKRYKDRDLLETVYRRLKNDQ